MGRSDAAVCPSSDMTLRQSAMCSAPHSSSLKAVGMIIRRPAAVYSASNSADFNVKRDDLERMSGMGQKRTLARLFCCNAAHMDSVALCFGKRILDLRNGFLGPIEIDRRGSPC